MSGMRPTTQKGCFPKLRPAFIVDAETGELVDENEANQLYVIPFLKYIREKTLQTIANDKNRILLLLDEADNVGSPTGFAWKHNIRPDLSDAKKMKILALSRVEKIIQHRIVSELSSYVNNPNPKKGEPTFDALKANIGAADKQICSIEYQEEIRKVFVRFKCWLKELILIFDIPDYGSNYNISKYNLPTLKYFEDSKTVKYDLPFEESLDYSANEFHHCYGAFDLGRVVPYILTFKNHKDAIIAEYKPSGRCCQLNAKRERILSNIKDIQRKLAQYDALGIPADYPKRLTLIKEKNRLKKKARRQGEALAKLIGFEIACKCKFHGAAACAGENLSWVNDAHGSSRWNHSKQQEWVRRECQREGTAFLTVSAKYSSQTCSACGSKDIVHNSKDRTIHCQKCHFKINRDRSASRILSSRCSKQYRKYIAKGALTQIKQRC